MNKYELALVISAKLEDEARVEVVEKIKEYLGQSNATITNVDEWGKRRLAYEIEKMKEGFYYFIHYTSNSDAPNELEKRLRIMEPVLRYLCVRQDA